MIDPAKSTQPVGPRTSLVLSGAAICRPFVSWCRKWSGEELHLRPLELRVRDHSLVLQLAELRIDQHPEERHDEENEDPASLRPSRELVVPEEIADDRDQGPEVENEQEDLDDREKCVSEKEVGERHRGPPCGAGQVSDASI